MARVVSGALVALLALSACVGEARRPPPDYTVPTGAPTSVVTTTVVAPTTTAASVSNTITTVAVATTTTLVRARVTTLEAGPDVPLLVTGLLAFSGDTGDLAADQADAIQLAVETFGTIAGHDVLLAPFEDSRCSVDGGRAASRAIAATGGMVGMSPIVGVIGPTCDAAAIEAVPLLVDQGFVLVSPSIGDGDFTVDGDGEPGALWLPGLFTLEPLADAEAVTAARFAVEELGARRPAVVWIEGDDEGETSARVFVEALDELGESAVAEIAMDPDDVTTVVETVVDEEADAVFLAIATEEVDRVLEELAEVEDLDEVARIVLGDALFTDVADLYEAEGAFFVMADGWAEGRDVTGTRYRDVRSEYERLYGREPTLDAARAYDATMLLLSAVERVAEDRDGTLVIDRQGLVDALFAADQPGYTGRLRCADHGNCLEVRVRVFEHVGDLSSTLANEVWTDE